MSTIYNHAVVTKDADGFVLRCYDVENTDVHELIKNVRPLRLAPTITDKKETK